ncbi:MAG: DUF4407 domain-containing protein [Erythrobacter sp.]|nr:DUF4407 domain-containing protein [Erythrobacter sp.]
MNAQMPMQPPGDGRQREFGPLRLFLFWVAMVDHRIMATLRPIDWNICATAGAMILTVAAIHSIAFAYVLAQAYESSILFPISAGLFLGIVVFWIDRLVIGHSLNHPLSIQRVEGGNWVDGARALSPAVAALSTRVAVAFAIAFAVSSLLFSALLRVSGEAELGEFERDANAELVQIYEARWTEMSASRRERELGIEEMEKNLVSLEQRKTNTQNEIAELRAGAATAEAISNAERAGIASGSVEQQSSPELAGVALSGAPTCKTRCNYYRDLSNSRAKAAETRAASLGPIGEQQDALQERVKQMREELEDLPTRAALMEEMRALPEYRRINRDLAGQEFGTWLLLNDKDLGPAVTNLKWQLHTLFLILDLGLIVIFALVSPRSEYAHALAVERNLERRARQMALVIPLGDIGTRQRADIVVTPLARAAGAVPAGDAAECEGDIEEDEYLRHV